MIVDLSHEIVSGMRTYPGLAGPQLQTVVSRKESAERLGSGVSPEIASITLVGNTGTYVDAPFHFHADRADVAQLPLERLVNVPIVMIQVRDRSEVSADDLGERDRLWGRAVLVHTGWSRHWGTDRYLDFDCPHLRADAVDALNIDDPSDPDRPAHNRLLGANIPIIEHLTNLQAVPDAGARLTAVPPPARGMASFPV